MGMFLIFAEVMVLSHLRNALLTVGIPVHYVKVKLLSPMSDGALWWAKTTLVTLSLLRNMPMGPGEGG